MQELWRGVFVPVYVQSMVRIHIDLRSVGGLRNVGEGGRVVRAKRAPQTFGAHLCS